MSCPTCGSQFIMRHLSTGDSRCMTCNFNWNGSMATTGLQHITYATQEEMERAYWDNTQSRYNKCSDLDKLMSYFLLNRNGYRMDGIEKKIEVLMGEKWKKEKAK